MTKIVINDCYGGFGLSHEAEKWMKGHKSKYKLTDEQDEKITFLYGFGDEDLFPRHSKILVDCVEKLGQKANGNYSNLKIVEISGNKYNIFEEDGKEEVVVPEDYDDPNEIDWIEC